MSAKKIINKGVGLFLLFFTSFAFSQSTLRVDYEVVMIPHLGNINVSEEMKERILKQFSKPTKSVLFYSKGDYFYSNKNEEATELGKKESFDDKGKRTTTYTTRNNLSDFYGKKNSSEVYVYRDFGEEKFYEFHTPNWKSIEYKDETTQIDGFTCKLVQVINQKDEVIKIWYTESIPLSIGPSYYYGFPGLVMKVEGVTVTIYATKVSNEASDKDVKKIDSKLKVYKGEELRKKLEELTKPKHKVIRRTISL